VKGFAMVSWSSGWWTFIPLEVRQCTELNLS